MHADVRIFLNLSVLVLSLMQVNDSASPVVCLQFVIWCAYRLSLLPLFEFVRVRPPVGDPE